MDREQHITQDAAEHYAVFAMADHAKRMGLGSHENREELQQGFHEYLDDRGWGLEEFSTHYPDYKYNVDLQVPAFVERLAQFLNGQKLVFRIDEAKFRNLGKKADFSVGIEGDETLFLVSLKNYIGSSGISRPQVSSGTFLSFASGFVFTRAGVGTYLDPRYPGKTFKGSNVLERNEILKLEGRGDLIPLLSNLDRLQEEVREELLNIRFYDAQKVKAVVASIVPKAQSSLLSIFDYLGPTEVRAKLLERVGLDGEDHVFFFDKSRSIDSITSAKFHELTSKLNDPTTNFEVNKHGQGLRFEFSEKGSSFLSADIPLTINTNGAWHRPKNRYTGTETKNDKGHLLELQWGEIRPHKSKEIATSINSYLNLAETGIFDD